jgi:hypothetical protein
MDTIPEQPPTTQSNAPLSVAELMAKPTIIKQMVEAKKALPPVTKSEELQPFLDSVNRSLMGSFLPACLAPQLVMSALLTNTTEYGRSLAETLEHALVALQMGNAMEVAQKMLWDNPKFDYSKPISATNFPGMRNLLSTIIVGETLKRTSLMLAFHPKSLPADADLHKWMQDIVSTMRKAGMFEFHADPELPFALFESHILHSHHSLKQDALTCLASYISAPGPHSLVAFLTYFQSACKPQLTAWTSAHKTTTTTFKTNNSRIPTKYPNWQLKAMDGKMSVSEVKEQAALLDDGDFVALYAITGLCAYCQTKGHGYKDCKKLAAATKSGQYRDGWRVNVFSN